jgi:hypothetical protein
MGIKPQISPYVGHLLNAENPVVEQPVTGAYGVCDRIVEAFDPAVPQQGEFATVQAEEPGQFQKKELQIRLYFLLASGHV